MFKLIDEYTREAGVRNLKREIINICRKIAREVVEKDIKKFNLKASDLEKYLGKAKFRPEKSRKSSWKSWSGKRASLDSCWRSNS